MTPTAETTNTPTRKQVAREARKMRQAGTSFADTCRWIAEKSGYVSAKTGQPVSISGAQSILVSRLRSVPAKRRRSAPKTATPPPAAKGLTLSRKFIAAVSALPLGSDDKLALIQLVAGA